MPHPPVHVIGCACRLPGGLRSLGDVVAELEQVRDVLGRPPTWRGFDRFEGEGPGRCHQLRGGWLEDELRDFDPGLFGLNVREARDLDPQQRLLLRCTREALDDAGVMPEALGRVGTWIGISGSEYKVLAQRRDPSTISPYIGTGTHPATASGRLAYTYGFEGPAVAVDTACSSGMVALHLALQALRHGEIDAAVVGAVNVLLDPQAHVSMSAMGTLSRRGACHSFSALADGYVRSEGCVVLLLRRGGPPGIASVRGSACNQDGRSSGLTAPRAEAQVAVLSAALAQAECAPEEVGYHEGHGSATPLGDRVELSALQQVFGGRSTPLPLGSVKARMGHLEAAAGLAGVVHALAVLRSGRVPAMPHAEPPTPALAGTSLVVPTAPVPLAGAVATACGFGIGGTNAAVVLERSPDVEPPPVPEAAWLCLSGTTERTLHAQRVAVLASVETTPYGAVALASQTGLHGSVRQAVWATGADVRKVLDDAPIHHLSGRPAPLFAFPGQGVARPGLGRDLATSHPEAAAVFEEVFAVADPLLPYLLRDRLWADGDRLLSDMPAMQVGVFAVGVAWARVLRAWGVEPAAVMGHSSGEWAAAVVAGMVSLEDAVRVLVRRGQLLEAAGPGGMWAAFAPAAEVQARLVPPVGIAAVNHPSETVFSGPVSEGEAVAAALAAAGFEVRRLKLEVAGHSVMLEPHLDDLRQVVASVTLRPPTCLFVSTATGDLEDDRLVEPDYWARQFRDPVRLDRALEVAVDEGLGPVVELGPHPMMASAAHVMGLGSVCLGHRESPAARSGRAAMAELWSLGVALPAPAPSVAAKPRAEEERTPLWLEGLPAEVAPCWRRVWRPLALREAGDLQVVSLRPPSDQPLEALLTWAQEQLLEQLAATGPRRIVAHLDPQQLAHHGLAGWLRGVRWERDAWGLTIVWGEAPEEDLTRLPPGEEGRRHDGSWEGRRLVPVAPGDGPPVVGHWVITGGFGALGLRTARWLGDRGATHLTLVGRRGCPEGAEADVAALREHVRVTVVAADVSEGAPEAVDDPELAGIVHAAGVVEDAAFFTSGPDDRARVLAPKVGIGPLLEAVSDRPAVWVVGYSSLTGAVGGEGQTAYGAANAWLDEQLRRRDEAGGRAVSIAWGPWQGDGLAADTLDRRRAQGLPPMDPEAAMAALGAALAAGTPWLGVVDVDEGQLASALRGRDQPLWSEVVAGADRVALSHGVWADHEVAGEVWISAADQLAWALERSRSLREVQWLRPVVVPAEGTTVQWDDLSLLQDGTTRFRASAGEPGALPEAPTVAEGGPIDLEALYASFRERGVVHGVAWRRGTEARRSGDVVWGRAQGGTPGQRLDGLLSLAATWASGERALVPAGVDEVHASEAWPSLEQVVLTRTAGPDLQVDAVGLDADGRAVLWLRGLRWAQVEARSATTSAQDRWTRLPPAEREAEALDVVLRVCRQVFGTSRIVSDQDMVEQGLDSILALELRDKLVAEGLDVPLHHVVGGSSPADLARLAAGAFEDAPVGETPTEIGSTPRPSDGAAAEVEHPWAAWGVPFFVGALVGATVWALIG